MNIKYDVYIAGSMHGRKVGEVLGERMAAKGLLQTAGLSFYDPAADEGLDDLRYSDLIDSKPNLRRMEHYVKKDDAHVDRSRYLLVLTGDSSTSGTAWEMARHYYRNKRKIVLVSPKRHAGKLVNFTSIKAYAVCPTIEDAVKFIVKDKR